MKIVKNTLDKTTQKLLANYGKKARTGILNGTKITRTKNRLGEAITLVDGEIPIDLKVKNKDRFLFISYDQSSYTHGLHKYPAKFFPELPRWFITKYTKKGDWILDPFTGSGTVNVECLLAHRHSVGLDIDPFARFLAKVKVTPLDIYNLEKAQAWIRERIENFNLNTPSHEEFPSFPYRDNWFNPYILEELTFLKKIITELEHNMLAPAKAKDTQNIVNFFLVCLSSIIRAVSNADDNCTRTVIRKKLNKRVEKGDALSKFIKAINTNVPKMIAFSRDCPPNVKVEIPDEVDARNIKYPDNTFHLAITSPPYVNAVDYPRTHQLEMYWLGIANGSLLPLKRLHVGTESVLRNEYKHLHKTGLIDIDRILGAIYEKDPRRSYILYKYLMDMQENLVEVRRVLKPGGRYVIAIGNNRIRGHLVETWKYLLEIAQRVGFHVDCYFASEIIRHFIKVPREERIETDWVIVLKK